MIFDRDLFEQKLELSLNPQNPYLDEGSRQFFEAMNYALLSSGGKRLRPQMVFAAAEAITKDSEKSSVFNLAMPAALSVEYIHSYSLVHDDLPCMDDAYLRRGKPSVHARFGEACAILVGDALLTKAFLILSGALKNAEKQVAKLAEASGHQGMVLGQVLDIFAMDEDMSKRQKINALKTGRLMSCATALGGLSMGASAHEVFLLEEIGQKFGEAYQLKDDLDDENGFFLSLGREDIASRISSIFKEIDSYAEGINIFPLKKLFHSIFENFIYSVTHLDW